MHPEVNAWFLGVHVFFERFDGLHQAISINVQFSCRVRHELLEVRILALYLECADRKMVRHHCDRAISNDHLDLGVLSILQDQVNSCSGDQVGSLFGSIFSARERHGVERGSMAIGCSEDGGVALDLKLEGK